MSAGVLLGACDSSENGPDRPRILLPLEAGIRWVAAAQGDSIRAVVTQEGSLRVVRKSGQDSVVVPLQVERQSGGLSVSLDGEEVFLFRYPVGSGDSYKYTDAGGTVHDVSVSRESITVPAGFYECLLYTIREAEGGESRRVWMKPALGPVRVDLQEFGVAELVSTNVEDGGGYP